MRVLHFSATNPTFVPPTTSGSVVVIVVDGVFSMKTTITGCAFVTGDLAGNNLKLVTAINAATILLNGRKVSAVVEGNTFGVVLSTSDTSNLSDVYAAVRNVDDSQIGVSSVWAVGGWSQTVLLTVPDVEIVTAASRLATLGADFRLAYDAFGNMAS